MTVGNKLRRANARSRGHQRPDDRGEGTTWPSWLWRRSADSTKHSWCDCTCRCCSKRSGVTFTWEKHLLRVTDAWAPVGHVALSHRQNVEISWKHSHLALFWVLKCLECYKLPMICGHGGHGAVVQESRYAEELFYLFWLFRTIFWHLFRWNVLIFIINYWFGIRKFFKNTEYLFSKSLKNLWPWMFPY